MIVFQLWLAASLAFGAVWALAGLWCGEPEPPYEPETAVPALGLDGMTE